MNQINLTDDNSSENKSFAINVDDQDIKLPDDLGGNESSSNVSLGSGFEFSKYKNWFFVLGGTVLIFVAVIFSLSNSSTEIQERLEATEVATEETVEDNIPSFFMGSLVNVPGGSEVPDETLFTATEEDDDDDFMNWDLDFFGNEDEEEENDEEEDETFEENDPFFGSFDETDTNTGSDPDSLEALLGMIGEVSDSTEVQEPFSSGPNLNSNTTPETLMTDQMQGDTGPAVWLALIPSFAYAIIRRRRS